MGIETGGPGPEEMASLIIPESQPEASQEKQQEASLDPAKKLPDQITHDESREARLSPEQQREAEDLANRAFEMFQKSVDVDDVGRDSAYFEAISFINQNTRDLNDQGKQIAAKGIFKDKFDQYRRDTTIFLREDAIIPEELSDEEARKELKRFDEKKS